MESTSHLDQAAPAPSEVSIATGGSAGGPKVKARGASAAGAETQQSQVMHRVGGQHSFLFFLSGKRLITQSRVAREKKSDQASAISRSFWLFDGQTFVTEIAGTNSPL